jgi:hypothetical protein
MTNHQCFCYGIIAIHNIIKEKIPITSDIFYDELYYLWDIYSEEAIEQLYEEMKKNGKLIETEKTCIKDW